MTIVDAFNIPGKALDQVNDTLYSSCQLEIALPGREYDQNSPQRCLKIKALGGKDTLELGVILVLRANLVPM